MGSEAGAGVGAGELSAAGVAGWVLVVESVGLGAAGGWGATVGVLAAAIWSGVAMGRVKLKVVPLPTSVCSSLIWPFMCSTSSLEM